MIIAAYNCEKYIEKALRSIFMQSVPPKDYEVIVVNDGSIDNTPNVLNRYKDRIKLINQTNQGLASVCNRGLKKAKGDYIMRVDADDYCDKRLLSLTLNILETMPMYHYVYTDRYEVNAKDSTKIKVSVGKDNIFDMVGSGILFRKEIFDKVGLYRNLLFEEYDLMIRLSENNLKGYYLPKPLYYYVRHNSNMTQQQNYWKDGWAQLVDIWGEEKLKKYIDIQTQFKGTSRFPAV